MSVACSKAGISRQHAYRTRQLEPEFAEAWQTALDASVDALEAKAFELARAGDSGLIQWLLRAHRGNVYNAPNRNEHAVLGKIVLIPTTVEGDE